MQTVVERCCADAIYRWSPQANRLRVKDADDRGTTVRPNRKRDACRCLGVREIGKISRWIEGIQTTYRPSTVGTAYEHEMHRWRTAALPAIVDEGHAM